MKNGPAWSNVKQVLGRSRARLLERAPTETLLLSGAALFVGLASGAGVWLFKQMIDLVYRLAFEDLGGALRAALGGAPSGWTIALIPMLGGAVVGWIAAHWIGEERHHGVAGVMEAAALAGGRLRYARMPAKALASAISIGSGASVGPEDPSVQIGANLGSLVGSRLRLSDERMRTLVAAGAAAGIAAAFNAPIAGVFFALEVILGEIGGSAFGLVVITAVVSAAFTQAVSGEQPAFHVPPYAFSSAWELPLYLGVGAICGPTAALYVRLLYRIQDLFARIHLPAWLKTALTGGLVGLVGIFLPQVFGVGYATIEGILNGRNLSLGLLLALAAAKLILTPVSLGGGFKGGVFAPSLYIGAALGGAYGLAVERLFPSLPLSAPAFAMVGMAAVLAGAVHAPLTAILLLFEMTRDYRIILPLMFAVAVSLLLSQRLERDSVYLLGLARKGIHLERGRDVDLLDSIQVEEVMNRSVVTLYETDTLEQAAALFQRSHRHGLGVLDAAGRLVGICTLQDLEKATDPPDPENLSTRPVGQVCTRQLITAYPDETIGAALQRMGARDLGRLPVVARNDPTRLVGVLRRSDAIRAYDIALARRAAARHRIQQTRLDAATPERLRVSEVVIQPGALCEGKRVREIAWPDGCVLASLRRGSQIIVPQGETVLKSGDVLAAVSQENDRAALIELCTRQPG